MHEVEEVDIMKGDNESGVPLAKRMIMKLK